ncbi:hypothetical protein [Nocardia sp. NPDC049707]|uniref:hypothetical protein n=1 Tax=Nocardia sp. NPDC049707 TaxID=3154735 RepID=UPI0034333CCB
MDTLNPLGLAYLHVIERGEYPALADLRPRWSSTLIANFNGPTPTTRAEGEKVVDTGLADVFSFGRAFIANPDLPARFASGAPVNEYARLRRRRRMPHRLSRAAGRTGMSRRSVQAVG